jgi:hypothetical protein
MRRKCTFYEALSVPLFYKYCTTAIILVLSDSLYGALTSDGYDFSSELCSGTDCAQDMMFAMRIVE